MTSHLQQRLDAAIAEQVGPLGRLIEDTVGGLDDEQIQVVSDALQHAVKVGVTVAISEATAQAREQLAGKQVRCDGCGHLTPFEFDVDLVLAIEPDPPPPQ
jgi:hypothetical protein